MSTMTSRAVLAAVALVCFVAAAAFGRYLVGRQLVVTHFIDTVPISFFSKPSTNNVADYLAQTEQYRDREVYPVEPVLPCRFNKTLNSLYGFDNVPACKIPAFKVLYIVSTNWPSSLLRGRLSSTILGEERALCVNLTSFALLSDQQLGSVGVCVFVKQLNERACARCQEQGKKCLLDILDGAATAQVVARIDGLIVGSRAQQLVSARLYPGLRTAIVPHPHTNFNYSVLLAEKGEMVPRVVASISSVKKQPEASSMVAVHTWCAQYNAQFRNLALLNGFDAHQHVIAQFGNTQRAHHEFARGVDLAFLWPPLAASALYHSTRPVTRLVFWMSHGVPVVMFPSPPYEEIITVLGLAPMLLAHNTTVLISQLDRLMNNSTLRREVHEIFIEASHYYSARNIVEQSYHSICHVM